MKRFLTPIAVLGLSILPIIVLAQAPQFKNFDTNQFDTNNYRISIKPSAFSTVTTNYLQTVYTTNIYNTFNVSSNSVSGNIQGTTNILSKFTPDNFSLGNSIVQQVGNDTIQIVPTNNSVGTIALGGAQPYPGIFSTTSPANGEVNARAFQIYGNGTDESAKIQAAFDALPSGSTLRFPVPEVQYKAAGLIISKPITVIGPGMIKDYSGMVSNFFTTADPTKFILRVGDGTHLVEGVSLRDMTFYNPNGAGKGLYISTCAESMFNRIASWGFDTCVFIQAGTTQPSTLNHYDEFLIQQTTNTGSRGLLAVMPANQNSFTTDIEFRGHINCVSSGSNTYAVEADGCVIKFFGGYQDFQCSDHAILLSKHNAGALNPYVILTGTDLDGGGSAVLVTLDPSAYPTDGYPYDKIKLTAPPSGKIKVQSGATYQIPTYAFESAYLFNPQIFSGINFAKSGQLVPDPNTYIVTGTNGELAVHTTNQLTLAAGAANGILNTAFTVIDGNLYLTQPHGYRGYSTNGTDYPLIQATTLDNVQILTPHSYSMIFTNGGKIDFVAETPGPTFTSIGNLDSSGNLGLSGTLSLQGQTNRYGDNGTQPTFNGVPIGGGGSDTWTNDNTAALLYPVSGKPFFITPNGTYYNGPKAISSWGGSLTTNDLGFVTSGSFTNGIQSFFGGAYINYSGNDTFPQVGFEQFGDMSDTNAPNYLAEMRISDSAGKTRGVFWDIEKGFLEHDIQFPTSDGFRNVYDFIISTNADNGGNPVLTIDTVVPTVQDLLTVNNASTNMFKVSGDGRVVLAGRTNQIIFGATNTVPGSSVAPTKWISVQVQGESVVYRLPLYQ